MLQFFSKFLIYLLLATRSHFFVVWRRWWSAWVTQDVRVLTSSPPSLFEFLNFLLPKQLLQLPASNLFEPRDFVFRHIYVEFIDQRKVFRGCTQRKTIQTHAFAEFAYNFHTFLLPIKAMAYRVKLLVGLSQGLVSLFAQELLIVEVVGQIKRVGLVDVHNRAFTVYLTGREVF